VLALKTVRPTITMPYGGFVVVGHDRLILDNYSTLRAYRFLTGDDFWPAASADSATTAEDSAVDVAVLANDTDADGDALQVSAVTDGGHGKVAIGGTGLARDSPDPNYVSPDSFTYTARDARAGHDLQ